MFVQGMSVTLSNPLEFTLYNDDVENFGYGIKYTPIFCLLKDYFRLCIKNAVHTCNSYLTP